ncbi:MAG TPA: hypothetical protein VLS89_16160 [Candidatus Nanopelagicales bacterium]|nr:hypothetical protein [Candidatus Nanopelagicales bacterium]
MSSSLGADENAGTKLQPVRSIQHAIELASAGHSRVYACAEEFREAVDLPPGVELWGGLDCIDGWRHVGNDRKTTLATSAGEIPLRVTGNGPGSIVADIRAEAADATEPGGSSIAMLVLPDASVEILRSELVAGHGAPGLRGEDGSSTPAKAGTPGNSGANACSADVVLGGAPVETVCGDAISVGAQGGAGYISSGADGEDGQPEPSPSTGHGLGGVGMNDSTLTCINGMNGHTGRSGDHGLGAKGPGRLTISGWEGEKGQDGGDGEPAQGGGGGGGRAGGNIRCGFGIDKGGAGGGGGGGGGCGGKGAKGGGFGGASIGLVSLSPGVSARSITIVTGNGGDGGNGGFPQFGGAGGARGLGGSHFYGAATGCNGGPGGSGGHGGFGGGGLGGPSIGIAHLAGAPVAQEDVTIEIGLPGMGGLPDYPDMPPSIGEDGVAAPVFAFP